MLDEFKNDTIIVHVKQEPYDVYIGRPSIFGNPFTHIKDKNTLAQFIVKTREEAISKYREWVVKQPHIIEEIMKLKGKRLGCWCKNSKGVGKACHGDVIIEILNR